MRPRPVIPTLLAYWAGLATGLSHVGDPRLVPVILLAATALLRGRPAMLVPAAALTGRVAAGFVAARDGRHCRNRLPTGTISVTGTLEVPVTGDGGQVAFSPHAAGCHGAVTAHWVERQAAAGTRWRVTGRWVPPSPASREGVLLASRAERLAGEPGVIDRLRTRLEKTTRRLYGRRAGLVEAIVLNRRDDLPRDIRDRWAAAGIVHLLCISGFHVGIVAGWCFLLLRLCRLNPGRATIGAVAAAVAYVAFIGWPAPATRAAALLALLAWCRYRQRRVEPAAILAVAWLILFTIAPRSATTLGAMLSIAAVWGTVRFARWAAHAWNARAAGRTVAASAGATLATAPITAWALGAVAPVGIVVNLLAIPLAALAVPALFGSLVLALVLPPLAGSLAAAGGLLLALLDAVASLGARVPGGHLRVEPGLGPALPWVVLLLAALWATGRKNRPGLTLQRMSMAVAGLAWFGVIVSARRAHDRAPLALHFLRVGQGDATLIRTPGRHWVLVDAGPAPPTGPALVPLLRRLGVRRLSAVILSHAHADHFGGLPDVLSGLPVGLMLDPGDQTPDTAYRRLLEAVDRSGVPWRTAQRGLSFSVDGVAFEILHPDTLWKEWGTDLNEDSIVLRVTWRNFEALLAGDAGFPAESTLAGRVGAVDLLKAGHHGSAGSTGEAWLAELRPRAAILSFGRNRYGHPAPATVARLARHGVRTWTTRRVPVVVRTDGSMITIEGDSGIESFPALSGREGRQSHF